MLTDRMLASGVTGYVGVAATVGAFLPMLGSNFATRDCGATLGFLATWWIADIFNLLGLFWDKAPINMRVLALWYLFVDTVILLQLFWYGRFNEARNWHIIRSRGPRMTKFMHYIGSWRSFEKIRMLFTLILLFLCFWATLLLANLRFNANYATEIPHTENALDWARIWGYISVSLFMGARIFEFIQGESQHGRHKLLQRFETQRRQRSNSDAGASSGTLPTVARSISKDSTSTAHHHEKAPTQNQPSSLYDSVVEPDHDTSSPLFWLLIIDNVFLLASIIILDDITKKEYALAQMPWIVGSSGAILFDVILLLRVKEWRKLYHSLYEQSAYFHELKKYDDEIETLQIRIDKVEEEKAMFEHDPQSKAQMGLSPKQRKDRDRRKDQWDREAFVQARMQQDHEEAQRAMFDRMDKGEAFEYKKAGRLRQARKSEEYRHDFAKHGPEHESWKPYKEQAREYGYGAHMRRRSLSAGTDADPGETPRSERQRDKVMLPVLNFERDDPAESSSSRR